MLFLHLILLMRKNWLFNRPPYSLKQLQCYNRDRIAHYMFHSSYFTRIDSLFLILWIKLKLKYKIEHSKYIITLHWRIKNILTNSLVYSHTCVKTHIFKYSHVSLSHTRLKRQKGNTRPREKSSMLAYVRM